jgi:hypothetical protein
METSCDIYVNCMYHTCYCVLKVCIDTALCDKVCQWLVTGWWFSSVTPVSSTNKTDSHDITEILLKVELNTKTLTLDLKVCIIVILVCFHSTPV